MSENYTAADKFEAVEREIKYRRRVYHRLVLDKKMTEEFSARQIGTFEAIAEDYRKLAAQERLI